MIVRRMSKQMDRSDQWIRAINGSERSTEQSSIEERDGGREGEMGDRNIRGNHETKKRKKERRNEKRREV